MESEIVKRLKLKKTESYDPCFEEFIGALKFSSTINVLDLYESNIENGLFIEAEVAIPIPSGGVYRDLDVREKEGIIFFLSTEYPFRAPVVIVIRDDFPYSHIPHLNIGVSKSKIKELNLCLYRGDIDEWFYSHGPEAFCDLINEWFSDLVNGELIKKDGFEGIRIKNSIGVVVADYESLEKKIENDDREKGHYILSLSATTGNFAKVINEDYQVRDNLFPCLVVFDKRVNAEYFSGNLEMASDLKSFFSYQSLNRAVKKYRNMFYDPKTKDNILTKQIFVILAIKRPQQVIGSFGKFEFFSFSLIFDFAMNPNVDSCRISKMMSLQSLNSKTTERLSGTEFKKEDIIILGCGALGSKISLELARMGYLHQKLYDEDILMPHNLARHMITSEYAVGLNKAEAVALEIKSMYWDDAAVNWGGISSFACEELLCEEGIALDCTASERNLSWLCLNKKIKKRFIRSEIFSSGEIGITVIEGKNRNPDIFDGRVNLWYKAMDEDAIMQWLNQDMDENMEFHIGFGCGSDTMILDDATINNHASIVPHCINKYLLSDNGTVVINFFDKTDLTKNHIQVFEVGKYVFWKDSNGWDIHCPYEIAKKLSQIALENDENMGIWFGHINERMKRITIVDTFIPADNKRSAGNVTGGVQHVAEIIKKTIKRTGRMITYIGEWHTHPKGYAMPSAKDYEAFQTIKKSSRPFLMSIITHSDVGNWVLL